MATWSKNKVNSSEINKGMEYEVGDDITTQGLNAIVNNSFYATNILEKNNFDSKIANAEQKSNTIKDKIEHLFGLHNKPVYIPYTVMFYSDEERTITPKYTQSGVSLQYSLDGINWINIASGDTTPNSKIIYMRGKATGSKALYNSASSYNAWRFSGDSSNKLSVYGNLNYLLCDEFGDTEAPTTVGDSAYRVMFQNCISLVTAPELPATTVGFYGYSGMFAGCTSLVTAPELPATTIDDGGYSYMFEGCTSLVTAPELLATVSGVNAYVRMFCDCTSLKSVTLHYPGNDNDGIKFYNWLYNTAPDGVLYKAGQQFTECGKNTYPCNWTQVPI